MGSDAFEVIEAPIFPCDVKVHRLMCTELIDLVNRISKILQETEAAQPRCSNGIQSLCLLNNAISKAKLLLQHCSDSSKLYLALTGDAMLAKCQKCKNLLEQSLSQLQHMVPVMLAAEISRTVSDLRGVVLRLDPSEQDAGEQLRELLHLYRSPTDSSNKTVLKAFQVALLRLQITSQKDLLIEKRSIKKQLDKVAESDPTKRKILLFLQYLLKKYGALAVKEKKENDSVQHEELQFSSSSCPSEKSYRQIGRTNEEAQVSMWHTPAIPEEFKCPLSLRLMYDPVVIASGQTFERFWIQKWLDEGHNVCPKTKTKLDYFSLTPNVVMKNLIAEWCANTGVTLTDPSLLAVFPPLESSSSSIGSLSSLSSSMKDLAFPIDMSNLSVASSDTGQGSDSCEAQVECINWSSVSSVDSPRVKYQGSSRRINMGVLVELDSLSWESKCKVIKDIVTFLKHDQTCSLMSCETFIQPLLKFLKDAHKHHDVEALKTGCLLLSAFVEKCRNSNIQCLEEEAYQLLASFLDTEIAEEIIGILEILSSYRPCDKEIAASGALNHFLRILDKEISDLKEPALKILCNLSARSEIKSLIVPSDFIPKLISQLEDSALARYCIMILRNLCDNKDARAFVAESDGCMTSIIKLLEVGSQDDQEHAVSILLSLCSQHIPYCQVVMNEGIIPPLVAISVNGNNRGQAMAMELLRILRDEVRATDNCRGSDPTVLRDPSPPPKERKSAFKVQGFFGKMSRRDFLTSTKMKK